MGNAKIVRFGAAFISEEYTHIPLRQKVLDILRQVILYPLKDRSGLLCKDFVELEKSAVLDIIKTKINNKKSFAFSRCRDILLEGDDCGVSKHGSEETALELSPLLVTDFYKRMIRDFAVEFFYEGSADPTLITELVKDCFSELISDKAICASDLGKFIPPPVIPFSALEEDSDSEQTILCMGFETPHTKENDFSGRLFTEILSTSAVSRLFMNIREKRGLCYFCDYSPISKKDRAIITLGLKLSKIDEAKEAILEEIRDLANGNISEYELNVAKASLKNAYLGVTDSPHSIESWEIASLLLDRYLSPEDVIEKIEALDGQDVANYARGIRLLNTYVLKEDANG